MRRFVKRRTTENREASPRHLPGGYGARARDDERQRASWEAHGCRCLRRASGSKPPWRLAAASYLGDLRVAGELRQFGGSFAQAHAWLVSYRSLAFKLGPQYLCLNPAAEQFREPADGFHTRCFLVPIEVHSDSDRTLQPARQVAAEESEAY